MVVWKDRSHSQWFVVITVIVVVGSVTFAWNTICITVTSLPQKNVICPTRKPTEGFFFPFNVSSFGSSRFSGYKKMQKWWEPTVWHCNCHRTITMVLEFAVVKVDGKLGCNGKGKCSSFVLLCLSLVLLVRQLQSIVRVHQAWLTVDDVYVVFGCVVAWGASIFGNGYGGNIQLRDNWWPSDRTTGNCLIQSTIFAKDTVCHFKILNSEMQKLGEVKQ